MTTCETRRKARLSLSSPHPPTKVGGRRTVLLVHGTRSEGPKSRGPRDPGHWSENRAGVGVGQAARGRAEQSRPEVPEGWYSCRVTLG